MADAFTAGPEQPEKLLLMAAHLHGPSPGRPIRANCWRILWQAMQWAGVVDEQLKATAGQSGHPLADDWYRTLIAMTRQPDSELLLRGEGNLGGGTEPPAWPAFTGCELTERGRRVAEQLLAAHPQYAQDV